MIRLLVVDVTAGWIETPGGPGKFVDFDPTAGTVTVEHDYRYLVEYPAGVCYVPAGEGVGKP